MEVTLFWSDKIKAKEILIEFKDFAQRMANRLMQGHSRYGPPDQRKKYMTRISLELKEYKKTGNVEQLYNIANYCLLESIAPENKKFHFDDLADSVTRDKL